MCVPIPSATNITPIRIRKLGASIFNVGCRETKLLTGPAKTSIRRIDRTTATTMTQIMQKIRMEKQGGSWLEFHIDVFMSFQSSIHSVHVRTRLLTH